jgi:FixJ family two-component response regulator
MIIDPEIKIYIIDDDDAVRRGLKLVLESGGYQSEIFDNVTGFLTSDDFNGPGCILLDVYLHGESGLDLHYKITEKFRNLPIIYITGLGDIPMSVEALKKGAINFLQKPVNDVDLFKAVEEAIETSMKLVSLGNERNKIKKLMDTLTPKEYEIFRYIIKGLLNKQIASELKIAEHTVKLHRGRITEKLRVKSAVEMGYMAEKLNII